MCGPQIRRYLFTFRPIASKQLNSLTTIITLSWFGGAEVTLWVREVSGSVSGCGKDFYVWFLFCCFCVILFVSKNTLFVTNFAISFAI